MNTALFQPPADTWHRLAPAYATVGLVRSLIVNVVVWAALAVGSGLIVDLRLGAGVGVVGAGWTLWRAVRAVRYARSWGYAERGEDLCITRGLWFKELTVIPYGRMQLAKVESGPISQLFGLATVTLVTASAHSNASIPGLPAAEAAALRDRLIEIGDATGAGL